MSLDERRGVPTNAEEEEARRACSHIAKGRLEGMGGWGIREGECVGGGGVVWGAEMRWRGECEREGERGRGRGRER